MKLSSQNFLSKNMEDCRIILDDLGFADAHFKVRKDPTCHPYTELIWAHPIALENKLWSIIPLYKSWFVVIYLRDGREIRLRCERGEKQAEELLDFLRINSPSTLFGYTEDLKLAWNDFRKTSLAQRDLRNTGLV